MGDLKTIVAATDFSACASSALQHAGRLAARAGAALHVLHAIDSNEFDGLASAVPFGRTELKAQLTEQARTRLSATVGESLGGVNVHTLVQLGHPVDTILKTVERVSADLLVVGAYGEGGPGRGAGTVATKCARRCPTDVLLVHETQADPMGTVIACVDFSDYTDLVVAAAADLADVDGAKLVLVHAYHNPFDVFRWGVPVVDTSGQYEEYVTALRGQLERIRERAQASHSELMIECELIFGVDYGRAVVAHAKELDADLTVLGAKGRTNLSYVLLGSTPERVLRDTTSSVLAVREPRPATRKR